MKKYILALLLLISLSSLAQDINELPPLVLNKEKLRERVFQTDKSLIINKIKEYQKDSLSRKFRYTESITTDDLDNISIIYYLDISPDIDTNKIKYVVDKNHILLHFPSQPHFFIWEESTQNISIAPLLDHKQLKSWYNFQIRHKKDTSGSFLISFFPLDRGRKYIVAFKDDNCDEYKYADVGYDMTFKDFGSLFKYYFYKYQYYVDIYKNRWNYNFN